MQHFDIFPSIRRFKKKKIHQFLEEKLQLSCFEEMPNKVIIFKITKKFLFYFKFINKIESSCVPSKTCFCAQVTKKIKS